MFPRPDLDTSGRNRKVALILGALLALSAVVAAGTWFGGTPATTADNSSVEVTLGPGSVVVGDDAAPVKVVIYEDFLCPSCRQLEESTRDFLRENAAKGTVQVEYRPINLLTDSTYSARALNVWAAVLQNASPQAALALHDLLFEEQPDTRSADEVTPADLQALVERAGAGTPEVAAALAAENKEFFAAVNRVRRAAGISSTPTVVIDGQVLSGMSVAALRDRIETVVATRR